MMIKLVAVHFLNDKRRDAYTLYYNMKYIHTILFFVRLYIAIKYNKKSQYQLQMPNL